MIKKEEEKISNRYRKIQQSYARLFVRDVLSDSNFSIGNEVYLSFNEAMLSEEMLETVGNYQNPLIVLEHESVRQVRIHGSQCMIFFRDTKAPFVAPLNAINRFIFPNSDVDLVFDCEIDGHINYTKGGKVLDFPLQW